MKNDDYDYLIETCGRSVQAAHIGLPDSKSQILGSSGNTIKKITLPFAYYHEVLKIEYRTLLENCPASPREELILDVDYIQSIPVKSEENNMNFKEILSTSFYLQAHSSLICKVYFLLLPVS